MKHIRISKWLKGVTFILAIMGLLFFGGVTYFINITGVSYPFIRIFFLWYTAACCYLILFNFWSVSTEIGRDNSFSKENGAAFRHMAVCGAAVTLGFVVKLIWKLTVLVPMESASLLFTVGAIAFEIIVGIIFSIVCEALSQLIYNAYEVKHENDLTI